MPIPVPIPPHRDIILPTIDTVHPTQLMPGSGVPRSVLFLALLYVNGVTYMPPEEDLVSLAAASGQSAEVFHEG